MIAVCSEHGGDREKGCSESGPDRWRTGAARAELRLTNEAKSCGDGCISAERQCKKDEGCACAAAGIQEDGGMRRSPYRNSAALGVGRHVSWGGRPVRQEQAQRILIAALGTLVARDARSWL
jgi:hypothetical protein